MASLSSHHLPLTLPSVLPPVGVKLDRSNYVLWKSQVLQIVQAYDLEGFLFGTKTYPSESLGDFANPDFVHWHRLYQFLLSWLLLTITESMLGHVLHCHTSYAIWKTLEQLFPTKSKAQILNLHFSSSIHQKRSMSVEDYFLTMKSIAHDLMVAGHPISNVDLVLYILGGIGQEYESVIVNLTSKDSVTLTEVQFLLQTHGSKLENLHTSQVIDVSSSAHPAIKRDSPSSTHGQ